MAGDVALVVVGLLVLAKASDIFVVHAARLASALGVSPVVIGAVVLGFGTGVPELLVSGSAAARGSIELAMGNVVGSNLANLTLVLGVGGLIARPETMPRVLRREAPISFASVALVAVVLQGGLTRAEGVTLLVALAVAMLLMLRGPAHAAGPLELVDEGRLVDEVRHFIDSDPPPSIQESAVLSPRGDVAYTVLGLAATVAAAQLLVVGALSIAEALGLSGGFVGLTLVAIGTSLPELVTAVQSARRDETALLVGNVLGSNVFNSLAVAGACALMAPGLIDDRGLTVLAAGSMVLVAALAWVFLGLGRRLRRWEAAILLGIYVVALPLTG